MPSVSTPGGFGRDYPGPAFRPGEFGDIATAPVPIGRTLVFEDSVELQFGNGAGDARGDVYMRWDGTDFDVLPAVDDSIWKFGNGTLSWDLWVYGSAAAKYFSWDASADDLKFEDSVSVMFGTGTAAGPGAAGDVEMRWDGTDFDVLAAADDLILKIGNGTNSFDLWVYGNVAGDYLEWDASASGLKLVGDARLDLSSATLAAANTDGGVIKAGTAAARVVEDTASMKFASFYWDDGATSGHAVGIYDRLYVTGAAGSGTALRAFTTVEDVAGATAHGAQISLNFAASGSITGLGVGVRGQVHVPNAAMPATGTYAAMQPEIYSDGANSDPSSVTVLSFLRIVNDGNATGIGKVDDKAFLIELAGGTIGAGNVMAVKTAAAVSHTLRIRGPNGTTYYLMVSDAQ